MTFDQAINKLQNGKSINRSGWGNSNYLILLPNMNNIYMIYSNNLLTPASCYNLNNNDLTAIDWQVIT